MGRENYDANTDGWRQRLAIDSVTYTLFCWCYHAIVCLSNLNALRFEITVRIYGPLHVIS